VVSRLFVVKDKIATIDRIFPWLARRRLLYEEAVEVGFLNR
jgi:hypothetical protein